MKINLMTLLAAVLLTAGLSYGATLLATRFQDMTETVRKNDACINFYANAMPKNVGGK